MLVINKLWHYVLHIVSVSFLLLLSLLSLPQVVVIRLGQPDDWKTTFWRPNVGQLNRNPECCAGRSMTGEKGADRKSAAWVSRLTA